MPDPEGVMRLEELTWEEAANVLWAAPVGLLPVGAIEAHGPHLPLNTDVVIARHIADRAAQALTIQRIPSVVLPALCYGVSFVGTCFPGTSPVDGDAVVAYVTSLLTHLASQGYRAICLCNAHLEPAHLAALKTAAGGSARASGVPMPVLDKREPFWAARLGEEFQRGSRHAGSYETSLMLAAEPSSVRLDQLAGLEPVWVDLPARLAAGARTFAEAAGTRGYFGDPSSATRAEGERLLDELASIVVELVRESLEPGGQTGAGSGRQ